MRTTHTNVSTLSSKVIPRASVDSYCVVVDAIIEDMPKQMFPDRPWGPGDNPKVAVHKFLIRHPCFAIDRQIDAKLLISVAPDGYLKRIC
jgi:cephalosporin hydroxylase